MARKGGIIVEVIDGKHKGKYGQCAHANQKKEFLDKQKVFINYFEDFPPTKRSIREDDKPLSGITNITNIKAIGFYD